MDASFLLIVPRPLSAALLSASAAVDPCPSAGRVTDDDSFSVRGLMKQKGLEF